MIDESRDDLVTSYLCLTISLAHSSVLYTSGNIITLFVGVAITLHFHEVIKYFVNPFFFFDKQVYSLRQSWRHIGLKDN